MRYDSFQHHRRSIRLKAYDYSTEGAYFVTICTQSREYSLESEPVRHMIQTTWNALPHRFPTIELDEFVIMPNHVHGIIWIVGAPLGAPQIANPGSKQGAASSPPTLALARVIRAFKSISAIAINQHFHRQGNPVWQRNYYEHIIRTEEDLNRIRQYIQDNPDNWEKDPERVKLP